MRWLLVGVSTQDGYGRSPPDPLTARLCLYITRGAERGGRRHLIDDHVAQRGAAAAKLLPEGGSLPPAREAVRDDFKPVLLEHLLMILIRCDVRIVLPSIEE